MKLLFVDACMRGEKSRTKRICESVIEEIKNKYPDIELETADIKNTDIKPLNEAALEERDRLLADGDNGVFDMARQFVAADVIVVGAPYWDLSFPAALKIYIENVAVNTIAFRYTDRGQEGLCKAKEAYYVTTCGGYMTGADYGYSYIKGVFGLFGIQNVKCISAEGLDIIGNDAEGIVSEVILKAKEVIKQRV